MKPCFSIINNGKDLAPNYAPILIDLRITDSTTDKADAFSLTLSDVGNTLEIPSKGERVEISIGEDGQMIKTGVYVIDEVKIQGPPDIISLGGSACPFANADGMKAMQGQKSRSWDEITIGDLVAGIAAETGMEAAVSEEFASVKIPHVDQIAESSMNLLARIAKDYGATFKPADGRLVFSKLGDGKTIGGQTIPPLEIVRGPGMRWAMDICRRSESFGPAKVACHEVGQGYDTELEASGDEESPIDPSGEE